MQTSFFGTDVDAVQVLRWFYDIPEMKFFEDHSRPDQPNRWFETWDETVAYFQGGRSSLAAWPRNVGGTPVREQISFTGDLQRQLGAKGRSVLHSPALIRIIRNGDQMAPIRQNRSAYLQSRLHGGNLANLVQFVYFV
ncbi:hypothetical protein C5L14_28425 [Labrys okinawensis]|uniref:Uncharacterized protein n=1 Tax=Labrys okinawensis TaxID=346911 RepID=A0A2S9Q4C5_9HYPH|nr:hypothetical protein [Labrys okinawensis]PRH84212.1 hypothetical protein C5L14_28425 [Labrys okinawensis]